MIDTEEKIIEIETKLGFQEQTIDELNDVIIKQQVSIDKLIRQIQLLNNKIAEESQHWQNDASMADEKPPHY